VFPQTERTLILEHLFPSKSLVAIREAFNPTCAVKETRFRRHTSNESVSQLQQWDTAARIQYFCWFRLLCMKWFIGNKLVTVAF
jgi:hypothetical protein